MALSTMPIAPEERLIVALDVPTGDDARALVDTLGDCARFYKLGLELLMSGDYFDLLEWLVRHGRKVFIDLKFYDVPETVGAAIRQLTDKGATFATVHGNEQILKSACAVKGPLQILAVTLLTSLDQHDITKMGFPCSVQELALHRARLALQAGCDGVISSPLEAGALRAELGNRFLVVTPGIRPEVGRPDDDQKRVATAEAAFKDGADYIVVGRPIRASANPRKAAEDIQSTIARLFKK